jgi:O-succinylbenzoate synthase
MAKSGVENALWDAEAHHKGVPLSKLLGGTLDEIASGVSLGIRESPQALVKKVEEELQSGYRRIKLKIKPGKDIEYVAAVRKEFPGILLSVDANSAYRLEDAANLRQLDQFKLLMIEQPLNWDDIYAHSKLQAQIQTAICLDECINNARHALTAIELRASRIINIKLGRVGGHSEARRMEHVCRTHPFLCGAEECWRQVLEGRTTLRCRRSRVSRFREMFRRANAIGRKISSSRKSSSRRTVRFMCRKRPASAMP